MSQMDDGEHQKKGDDERRAAPESGDASSAQPARLRRKIDFSQDYVALEPIARAQAAAGDLVGAVESLLALEKRARLAADQASASKAGVLTLELCFEAGDLPSLNANLALIVKRRSQFRGVQTAVVEAACEMVGRAGGASAAPTLSLEQEKTLIQTIRTVSEGKIYLEVERARVARRLAEILEKDEGNLEAACSLLQEEQVESYGDMPRREKFEYVLEQMRLTALVGDWVRSNILANKIASSTLTESTMEDLAVRFHTARIEYWAVKSQSSYGSGPTAGDDPACLELARCYLSLYALDSEVVGVSREETLSSAAVHLAAAQRDNLQVDLMAKICADPRLRLKRPSIAGFVEKLRVDEIVAWPPVDEATVSSLVGVASPLSPEVLRAALSKRVVEHNVRTVALRYSRISLGRLASLLGLSEDEAEAAVARMATADTTDRETEVLSAKIDRPARLVVFGGRSTADELLTKWASDIDDLLSLVDETTRLVHKEVTLHEAKRAAAAKA